MGTKPINFRCPVELIEQLDGLSLVVKRSRNTVIVNAIQLLCREVRERGGYIIPSYPFDIRFDGQRFSFVGDGCRLPETKEGKGR